MEGDNKYSTEEYGLQDALKGNFFFIQVLRLLIYHQCSCCNSKGFNIAFRKKKILRFLIEWNIRNFLTFPNGPPVTKSNFTNCMLYLCIKGPELSQVITTIISRRNNLGSSLMTSWLRKLQKTKCLNIILVAIISHYNLTLNK